MVWHYTEIHRLRPGAIFLLLPEGGVGGDLLLLVVHIRLLLLLTMDLIL